MIPWETIIALLGALLGSGLIQFMISRHDGKNDKLDLIETKLDEHIRADQQESIIDCRVRILAFADDVRHQVPRSKGSWDQCVNDIDKYNAYCDAHPEFRNGIATACESLIMAEYQQHLLNNDFLV